MRDVGRGSHPGHARISRRAALRRIGAAAGAFGLGAGLTACGDGGKEEAGASPDAGAASTGRTLGDLGLQLYTVRSEMAADVGATLARVAEIGYREVEFAGYFDHPPSGTRALLDAAGLRAPSTHVGVEGLRDDPGPVLDAAATIGHEWVVVASIPEDMRGTLDDWRRTAELFNRIGETARGAGLTFGYHNHDVEIRPMQGRMPLDVLMESTDPDLVDLELDLFWITHGGGDPVSFLERWPRRVKLVHVKDSTADGRMADVGAGVIDFAGIFGRPAAASIRHYFVEHDQPGDPWASVTASFRHLSAMRVA
jgi:sugar phosphate isomerase/epimerase